MKTVYFFLLLSMCAYSCTPGNKAAQTNSSSYSITLHEGGWYFNFKNEVFMQCLRKLYPGDLGAAIDSTDASSAANREWLNYNADVRRVVDSLANAFAQRKEASWTIENRKVTMNICLDYRNSAELDAIAVSLYNKVHSKRD